MASTRFLTLYLIASFVSAAIISPWLYWLVQGLAHQFHAFQSLAEHPFHRFVNRALLGSTFLLLFPLFKSIGVKSPRDLGLPSPPSIPNLALGFALGIASLATVALLALSLNAHTLDLDHPSSAFFLRTTQAALSALVVALLEEILFRGVIFGALRRQHHWITALILSSAFYAFTHFFQKPPPPPSITWLSGFLTLGQMLQGFVQLETLFPKLLTLLTVGLLLGIAYQRTASLYFSIGLHAGWVFWLKSYRFLIDPLPDANLSLWGASTPLDGWLALIFLLPLLPLLWRHPRSTIDPGKV